MTELSLVQQDNYLNDFKNFCIEGNLDKIINEISDKEKKLILTKRENQLFILGSLEFAIRENKTDFVLNFFSNNETKQLLNNLKQDEIFINLCKNRWINLLNILIHLNIIENDTIKNIDQEFIEKYFKIAFNKKNLDMLKFFLRNENIRNKIKDEKIISFFSEALLKYKNVELVNILYNDNCIKNNNKFLEGIFYNICGFDFIESFEIIINNSEIFNKIISLDKEIIIDCFKIICEKGATNVLELFLKKDEIKNIIKKDNIIKYCFLNACNRSSKKDGEIVKQLVNDNIILDEIIWDIVNHNKNILKEKFGIACKKENIILIRAFIDNDKIRENIGGETIKYNFKTAYTNNNLNIIRELIENKNTTNLFPKDYIKELINNITINSEIDIRLSILLFKGYMLNNTNAVLKNTEYDNIKNKINNFSKKNKTYKSLNEVFNNIKNNPQRNLLVFMELEKELNNIDLSNQEERIITTSKLPLPEEWVFI